MNRLLCFFFLFLTLHSFGQVLSTNNPAINDAFKLATQTVDINVRRGVLAAGADYGGEWTRDISINSWHGVSLIRPTVAEMSLWSVTIDKDTIGHQYWDKIIWVIAANNHYSVNGDKQFLKQAYVCSANTMKQLEQITFDTKYGLFMGGSVFNDGIAAYPEPIYEPGNYSGSVMDHKGSFQTKCLSTNCVYYGAYLALINMATILNEKDEVIQAFQNKADALKANILKHLYKSDTNTFYYLIDQEGTVHEYQEALGISFAVIFGIIEGEKATQLISSAEVSKYGIASIVPDLSRYSKEMPGRHNNLIWPFINGFFANAAIVSKSYDAFDHELSGLTHLAIDEDKGNYNFREIFNPNTGKPDGGYQDWDEHRQNYHWESCRIQTWSATAYLSMVFKGLFGMSFKENTLAFSPYLPYNMGDIELIGVEYRDAVLDIKLKGEGYSIKSFTLDGKKQKEYAIPSTLLSGHEIVILLE